jgi:adenylate kinase
MNILTFGPNGSGKGTQGAIVQKKYDIAHIESGAIFRKNIGGGTELGKKAKEYIDRGDLVPDDITIPMILNRLKEDDCAKGWLLDGFPRNKVQAETLAKALNDEGITLNYVIEIVLDREIAKLRIMGRRLCVNDNNHPNHIAFDAIKPVEKDGKRPGRGSHRQTACYLLRRQHRHHGGGEFLQGSWRHQGDFRGRQQLDPGCLRLDHERT